MDLIDYIASTLINTFSYFKSRTKQKYEGDRFEEWVVMHSNIQKRPDVKDDKAYWRLLEWRSDKYISGWYSLSNLAPDLILECVKNDHIPCKEKVIAVECKYRNKMLHFGLNINQILNYEHFCHEKTPYIDTLYYLFGFQWQNGEPKEIYLIPSTEIYLYDKERDAVTFLRSLKV